MFEKNKNENHGRLNNKKICMKHETKSVILPLKVTRWDDDIRILNCYSISLFFNHDQPTTLKPRQKNLWVYLSSMMSGWVFVHALNILYNIDTFTNVAQSHSWSCFILVFFLFFFYNLLCEYVRLWNDWGINGTNNIRNVSFDSFLTVLLVCRRNFKLWVLKCVAY